MPHLDGTAPSPYSTETPQLARYVARQPILTPEERVFGYELLFRSGAENHFISSDPTDATRSVIDMSSLLGLGVLCDNAAAFINCTREILLSEFVTLLPPENLVLEVLSTVPPDEEVMLACSQLKKTGVKIALDDYVIDDPREPLAYFADFIKVDLKQTPLTDAGMIVASHRAVCKMVAMKVETRQDFQFAAKAGFQLVQGYFFRRPQMVRTWTGSVESSHPSGHFECSYQAGAGSIAMEDLIKQRRDPVLPAAPLSEFADVWFPERDLFRTAGAVDSWMRTKCVAGAGSPSPSKWRRPHVGPDAVRADPRPLLRTAGAARGGWQPRSLPARIAVHDGRDPGDSDGFGGGCIVDQP